MKGEPWVDLNPQHMKPACKPNSTVATKWANAHKWPQVWEMCSFSLWDTDMSLTWGSPRFTRPWLGVWGGVLSVWINETTIFDSDTVPV